MNRFAIPFLLAIMACRRAPATPDVRDGDIIFQTSRSSQSAAILAATGSRFSHMGLVLIRDSKPYVLEASATVRYTPLDRWIANGQGGRFVIKRLRDASSLLTEDGLRKLRNTAATFEGKKYDLTFEWSDDRIYCSELVWKAYDRGLGVQIGTLQHLRDFNLEAPEVRHKLMERFGSQIPLDETVVSPSAMFASERLETVSANE